MPSIDITGQRFGRLMAISPAYSKPEVGVYWSCLCDCGKYTIVPTGRLRCGMTKSCGCLRLEKFLERNKKGYGESSFKEFFGRYKESSKQRGLSLELSLDEFRVLTSSNCYYCGCPPSSSFGRAKSYGNYICNGVDRIDNTKGYTLDNCVPCCKDCNYMKYTHTQEEFLSKIKEIYIHRIEGK